MRHVFGAKTARSVVWSWPQFPLSGVGSRADETFAHLLSDDGDDLLQRYLAVRAVSSSPLRDDLELCLAELDTLIAAARARSGHVVTYLHFEMEERRAKVIDALQSGYEL